MQIGVGRFIGWMIAGLCFANPAHALVVTLQAPLTTVVPYNGAIPSGGTWQLAASVEVPADAPADLGVGAFVSDRQGRWFQRCLPGVLTPGTHELHFALGADAQLVAEPAGAMWNPAASALSAKAGLFFWSASASRAAVRIERRPSGSMADSASKPAERLCELRLDGFDDATRLARGHTGARWTLSAVPSPMPGNPDDPSLFRLDAVFTAPDGALLRVPAFAMQPMNLLDRGDREEAHPDGALRMQVRFRPRQPGRYRVRLEASWNGGPAHVWSLPDLAVAGEPWDDYVRIDAHDPRFFTAGGACYWPIGLNLHSPYDLRSRDQLDTVLTPDRGTLAYLPRLERFAAAGGNAVEIWMSSWNLALEWRAEWPGYGGVGRYNQGNAARLDAILDAAWAVGVRVNLVINNHGQASPNADREWKDNPYNKANGGPLGDPYELFTQPAALAGQEKLRRYLVARYADHPAVLGWKLWSEINLTAAGSGGADHHQTLVHWHEQAAARWRALDVYAHPITTHWAGDYRRPDFDIVGLPGIDYVCIDAYHGNRRMNNAAGPDFLAELLYLSTQDPVDGLGGYHKPLLVTEYGGSAQGCPEPQLIAEQASAGWAALVSGHGGAPMLWWFEWVDQREHWQPYRALAAFLAGEDPRGADGHCNVLAVSGGDGALWCRAWTRHGHMLGYIVDTAWAGDGRTTPEQSHAQLLIGAEVPAGTCRIQWWNADSGNVIVEQIIEHGGGPLSLAVPAFARHIAFKLSRADAATSP